MQVQVTLDQAEKLNFIRGLEKLPALMRSASAIGMGISLREVQRSARANHRFTTRSGNLERSISYQVDQDGLGGRVFLDTGVAKYGPYQHEGTGVYGPKGRAYMVVPKQKQALRWVGPNGRFVFSAHALIQGIKPDRFLEAAAERESYKVESIFRQTISTVIDAARLS